MAILYFILGLVALFFSKKWLTIALAGLISRFGGSRNTLIVIWSVIFLPGTIIHELSHFFFAILTGARTGRIEIFPDFLEEDWEDEQGGKSVSLGYVQTQRLNPVQGFLVGNAPFFVGLAIMVWLASALKGSFVSKEYLLLFLQGYLFFTIANSFFPSWPDLKQSLPLVIIVSIGLLASWILGFEVFITPGPIIDSTLDTLTDTVFISTAINGILVIALNITKTILSRK